MPRPKLFDVEVKTALTNRTHQELQRFAERDGRPVSDLIRDAISAHLKKLQRQEGQR
jgi:predicted DNA-binding protein